jgi:hypothetical protein
MTLRAFYDLPRNIFWYMVPYAIETVSVKLHAESGSGVDKFVSTNLAKFYA